MVSDNILKVKCRIEEVKPTTIPTVFQAKLSCRQKKDIILYLDVLKELYDIRGYKEVTVELWKKLPKYTGKEFVARGKVFSISSEDGYNKYLISMGGIILKILSQKPLNLDMLQEVFVKVTPTSQ